MSKSIEKFSLFLIRPDGTEHGQINHNNLEIFLSGINEISSISFKIPERIISNVGVTSVNPYYTIIKPSFRVRLEIDNEEKGTYTREFKISKPAESSDGNKTNIQYTAYSREVELNQKTIISFAGVSVNVNGSTGIVIENDGSITYNAISAQDHISYVLDGLTIADISLTLLANMDSSWELDYVDPALKSVHRSNIDVKGTQGLNALRDLQYTYDAVVVFDTVNKKVKYYKIDNLGEDLGWTIEYAKYLKSIAKEERVEDVVTRMRAVGANNVGIEGETYIGKNYVEDYTYFLGSFERDASKVVITSSEWMTDNLAGAILDYNELIVTKESALDVLITQRDGLIADKIAKQNEISFLNIGEDIVEEVDSVFHTPTVSEINLSKSSRIISDVGGIGTVDASIAGEYQLVAYQKTPNGEVVEDVTGSNYRYPVNVISGNNYPAYGAQAIYVLKSVYPDGTKFRLRYTTFGLNQIVDSKNAYESWLLTPTISDAQRIITEQIIIALKAVETTRVGEVATAEAELVVIQGNLDAADVSLDVIYDEISVDNNFTEAQQAEWESFIVEGVYQNVEVSDTKLLLSATQDKLESDKLPELNINMKIISILQTEDARVDWDKINLFDFVNVRFERLGIDIQARILEIRMSPETYGLELLISTTTNYIRDSLHLQQRALEKTIQSANDADYRIEEWNKSKESAETLAGYKESGISTKETPLKSANDDSVIIDGLGITVNEKVVIDNDYNPSFNTTDPANDQRYSNRLVRLTNGGIYLSVDGGKTFNVAISAGEVHADVIQGNLIVGNELQITGNDGSNDILEIGNIDTTGNSTDDDFGIMIDGVVEGNAVKMIMAKNNGFKIQVNGDDRFSVDASGKIIGRELTILDENDNEIISSTEYSQVFSYSQPIKTNLVNGASVEIIVVFPASITSIDETTFAVSFNAATNNNVSGDIDLNKFLNPLSTGYIDSASSTAVGNNAVLEFELASLWNFFLATEIRAGRKVFTIEFKNTGVNPIDLLDINVSMRMKSTYSTV